MRVPGLKLIATVGLLVMVALTATGCIVEPAGYYRDGWHHHGYGWR